jgi:hypothetical protein
MYLKRFKCVDKGIQFKSKDVLSGEEMYNKWKEITSTPTDIKLGKVISEKVSEEIIEKFYFYHSPKHVTVAMIFREENGVILLQFGFSKCRKNDIFSKKYGRDQALLRAKDDTTILMHPLFFETTSFVSIAKMFSKEIESFTSFGNSLISKLKLPEKEAKKKFTEEEIASFRLNSKKHIHL